MPSGAVSSVATTHDAAPHHERIGSTELHATLNVAPHA